MSVFKEEAIQSIIKKAKEDTTGETARVLREILDITKKAGEIGFTLQELSIIGTTGWYVSQDPRLEEFMNNLLSVPPPPPDDEFIN